MGRAVAKGDLVPDPLIPFQIRPSKAVFEAVRNRWQQMQEV